MSDLKKLRRICKDRNVELVERDNGHCQIKGPLLVNYYPDSRKRSAYIAGTRKATPNTTPKAAVAMCFNVPSLGKTQRSKKCTRKLRAKMLKTLKKCHWCPTILTLDTSTLEHIIPLAAGGLDNHNNRTLACEPCNSSRGSSMPELREAQ